MARILSLLGNFKRRVVWMPLSLFVLLVIFVAISIATRSPITINNCLRLQVGMSRAEVEELLGSPTQPVRVVRPLGGDRPWWMVEDIPGFIQSADWVLFDRQQVGQFQPSRLQIPARVHPIWAPAKVDVCTWDGLEVQIRASFDEKDQMLGADVRGRRLTWFGAIRRWVSWSK